jgi:hypothetical protein
MAGFSVATPIARPGRDDGAAELTGWRGQNEEQRGHGDAGVALAEYMKSGHFWGGAGGELYCGSTGPRSSSPSPRRTRRRR